VTKDVPPFAVVAGVPAKVMRLRFETELIERLMTLQWWRYDLSTPALKQLDMNDVDAFVTAMGKMAIRGELTLLQPTTQVLGKRVSTRLPSVKAFMTRLLKGRRRSRLVVSR
jgi:hypothetical protein